MGSADANQPIGTLAYWICIQIHDVKLSPSIVQKVEDGPLTSDTAWFLWFELSRHQIADKLQFFYLNVSYSNRMQKRQTLAVNLDPNTQHNHTLTSTIVNTDSASAIIIRYTK